MNYIILDLEWDNAYCHKKNGFANQIVQIGAVKLNSDFAVTDRIEILVKSCISKKLSKRFTELTGITTDAMQNGISFEKAVEKYNSWVGDDIVTVTWSDSDLYVIAENAKLFSNGKFLKLGRYADLQKYVQSKIDNAGKNQIALSAAAEHFGISLESFDLHTAVDDSMLTAMLLKQTFNAEDFKKFITDADTPEFFARVSFKNYYISNLNDKNVDKSQLVFLCDICGIKAEQRKKWVYRNHWFTSEFYCPNCGEKFIGRIMFKKTYSSVKVARKILRKPKVLQKDEVSV